MENKLHKKTDIDCELHLCDDYVCGDWCVVVAKKKSMGPCVGLSRLPSGIL